MGKVKDMLNNPTQVDKVAKAVFDSVDTDRSGFVSEEELDTLMRNIAGQCMAPAPTQKEVKEALQVLDQNKDGQISFEEFKVLVVEILRNLADKGL